MPAAAIVLAGGRSQRMGVAKAGLPWGGGTLLDHVVGVVAGAVDGPVVVVRAPGQELPPVTAAEVCVVEDPREGLGPVQGIAAGLAAVAGEAERAYVSAVDVPLLRPAFVEAVLAALDADHDVALPYVGGHRQPLAAAYRTALAPLAERLAAEGLLRTGDLFARVRVRQLAEADLPEAGVSVRNVNTPEDFAAAAREAGG
jgi:molybdopterin-guanine dinucleotide biosynthesis protein A